MDYVDVIIPAYNPGVFLDEAIRSALAQSYDKVNIIVVDDNSREDVEKITKKYKNITYIRNNKTLGPAASRNIAIEASDAPYISLLDADDIWCRNKLRRSMSAFKVNPDIGMTCGNYKMLINRKKLLKPFYKSPIKVSWNKLINQNFVASGTTTIRRDVMEQIGGFDESLWVSEDYKAWLTISEEYPIHYIHDVLYYYSWIKKEGSSLTKRADIMAKQDSNIAKIRAESRRRMNHANAQGKVAAKQRMLRRL